MTEFDNLKGSYAATVQLGLMVNVSYQESKYGNELIHEFCKRLIESSNYQSSEKATMKEELGRLKETLAKEIESYYRR